MGRIQAEGCQQQRKEEEIVVGDNTGLQISQALAVWTPVREG